MERAVQQASRRLPNLLPDARRRVLPQQVLLRRSGVPAHLLRDVGDGGLQHVVLLLREWRFLPLVAMLLGSLAFAPSQLCPYMCFLCLRARPICSATLAMA